MSTCDGLCFLGLSKNRHISGMGKDINKPYDEKLDIIIGNGSSLEVKLVASVKFSAFFSKLFSYV